MDPRTMKMPSQFTKLALLGQMTWNDDEIRKRCFVKNGQNIGLVDIVLKN
jgi:hypothetical protein